MRDLCEQLRERGWAVASGAPTAGMVMMTRAFGPSLVSASLQPDGEGVMLHRLRAEPPFSGGGKAGLGSLCEAADETGVALTLTVRPFGPQALDERALERLYEGFGFEPDPYAPAPSAMIRHPDSSPDFRRSFGSHHS